MVVTTDPLKTGVSSERIKFLKESQWWPKERLLQYQIEQLRKLLAHCAKSIPYYQSVFRKNQIDFSRVEDLSVLKKIPMISKKDIQEHYDEFIPLGMKKEELIHRSTGGSTGTPLTVYADLDFLSRDKSNTVFYMSIAGYDPFNFKSLRIYGDKIPEDTLAKGEYWYEKDNKLVMSCYHYSDQALPKYLDRINSYRPDYIHSRPSAILPMARYMVDRNISLKIKLGAIFLDGEFLNDAQRDLIERSFQCRVYNIYGHTEGCAVGVSCEHSRLLHFMPQVGILELVDQNGKDVIGEGQEGEMITTGFNNYVFPLIRYRTSDIAVHTNDECPCGRKFRMIKSLEGRLQDFVVNRDGQMVPLAPAVFNYNDMDWKGIKQFQVYQEKEGILLFRVQREPDVAESVEAMKGRLKAQFLKIFGQQFSIEIEYVHSLQRTRIGKFRYLEQKLNLNHFQSRQLS